MLTADVLVVGGGVGGVAAALAATELGASVILTEECDTLGGQLTSQAVPPDEHPWIEEFGSSRTYRQFRRRVRRAFQASAGLRAESRTDPLVNPGAGWVGSLCHLPGVSAEVIGQMLAPARAAGLLTVLTEHEPVACEVAGDTVRSVALRDRGTGDLLEARAPVVLDATETGELLPLASVEHVTGRESAGQTGEPHAPAEGDPTAMQAVTVCFAMDHRPGEDHVGDAPEHYAWWRAHVPSAWPGPLLGWRAPAPDTGIIRTYTMLPDPPDDPADADALDARRQAMDLWTYRRVLAGRHFAPPANDITVVNWPMTDYWLGPLFGEGDEEGRRHTEGARELARCFLHWLRTEAPRPDGGTGWPGLRLRPDVMGTPDGLAKRPYIRESRRIAALTTVVEQDLATDVRGDHGAVEYPDSVGVGCYRIDLHPDTAGAGYLDISSLPFQIPLRALLPQRVENLVCAAKNIGTTHITNGCYRLHPVEWGIGEAAGILAAFCRRRGTTPHRVATDPATLEDYQSVLVRQGVELAWPAGHRQAV